MSNKESRWSDGTFALLAVVAMETVNGLGKIVRSLLGKPGSAEKVQATLAVPAQIVSPPRERTQDLDEDGLEDVNLARRARWGTLFVTAAALVGFCSGVGFVYVYWTSPENTVLLGETLALSLGGLGVALVAWAHLLMRHKVAIEPRECLPSSSQDLQLAFEDFTEGKQEVQRRKLLTWMIAGFSGIFAASALSLIRSLGTPPGPSLYDRVWKRGQRLMTRSGSPVSVHALQPGSTMIVYPEGSIDDEKAQTVLIRVNEQYLRMPKDRLDWAPMGYVAYSRVCTHAGCPVGLYQKESHLLLCPCHQSSFDVLNGAEPTGGPAARALPQVPLYADAEGTLRAAGGFSTPPGPGFWGMPS